MRSRLRLPFLSRLHAKLPRDAAFADLCCLAIAQLVVALWVRHLLWPGVSSLIVLRSFAWFDLLVIAAFAAVTLALAWLSRGRGVVRGAVMLAAWLFTLVHIVLLVVNLTAIEWLRVPITWDWLELSDWSNGDTTAMMVSSVTTWGKVLGLVAALALPVVLVLAVRASRHAVRVPGPLPLAALAFAALATPLSASMPVSDPWRDAVSNPLLEMGRSLAFDYLSTLRATQGDGREADYALQPGAPPPMAAIAKPDILLVVLESVRWRSVEENLGTLPTFARLAREGTVFPRASVNNPGSTRAMFSLMFSRYPRFSGRSESRYAGPGLPPPITAPLRDAGYSTLFVQGGDFAYHSWDSFLAANDAGPLRGMTDIACSTRYDASSARIQNNSYLPDRCTLDAVGTWFRQTEGPRFAIAWTVGTHFPYDFLDEGKSNPHPSGSHEAYLEAIRETDSQLGTLLDALAADRINPVVLVTGDHGEQFGEHGANVHGHSIFEEEVAVPFILSGPGIAPGVVDDRLVQLVDIGPTLAQISGTARPAGWQGLSVLGETQRERAYHFSLGRDPVIGFRQGMAKYHYDLRREAITRFDLAADPLEQDPEELQGEAAAMVRGAVAGWANYNEVLFTAEVIED